LERKHTIFGKVEGNTIYNLLKIGDLATDKKTDRPIVDPFPTIKRVEVTINPFEDIVTRNLTHKDKYEDAKQKEGQ
jgi:peptidyl-prolyl cis-trans isomerase SDCCAG10